MSTLLIGATSVLRTLAVVAIGAFSATLLDNVATTNSWFSVVNVYIFLPCLLFGHFSTGFSLQVFYEGIPLVIFGICRIFIGAGATKLASFFGLFDDETQPLALLATSSSNAVAIPLAIMGELVTRVDFLSLDSQYDVRDAATGKMITAKKYVETLMFVYAIPINFSIWSFGQFFIRHAAEKKHEKDQKLKLEKEQKEQEEMKEQQEQQKQELRRADVSVGFDLATSNENQVAAQDQNTTTSEKTTTINVDENVASPALTLSSPQTVIRPFSSNNNENQQQQSTTATTSEKKESGNEKPHQEENIIFYVFRVYIIRSLSVPLVFSLGGIFVSLIPGVQNGITGGWPLPTALSNAIVLLGSAAVPAALITVGITVFRTLSAGISKPVAVATEEKQQQQEGNKENEVASTASSPSSVESAKTFFNNLGDKITNLLGIQASLVLTCNALQLVITPLVAYLLITKLIFKNDFEMIQNANSNGIFDSSIVDQETAEYWRKRRLMLFALLCESMCPSAMNTAIICTLYKYRSAEFSRMIVYQYIMSVFTMSLLMSLYLSSLQSE